MKIFWIDDDIASYTRPYCEELKDNGYHVAAFEEPDSAIEYFKSNHREISCAIVDIMLPPGKSFDLSETAMGTLTGKLLIEELLKINSKMPIIIFSISNNTSLIDWASYRNIPYLLKQATFPHELLRIIKELNIEKNFEAK